MLFRGKVPPSAMHDKADRRSANAMCEGTDARSNSRKDLCGPKAMAKVSACLRSGLDAWARVLVARLGFKGDYLSYLGIAEAIFAAGTKMQDDQ